MRHKWPTASGGYRCLNDQRSGISDSPQTFSLRFGIFLFYRNERNNLQLGSGWKWLKVMAVAT